MSYEPGRGPRPHERERARAAGVQLPSRRSIWTPFVLAVVAVVVVIVVSLLV